MTRHPTKRAVKTIVRRKGWPVWARWYFHGLCIAKITSKRPVWNDACYTGYDRAAGAELSWLGDVIPLTTPEQRRASLRRILSPKGRA